MYKRQTLTLTNNGPDDIDLGSYDGSGQNPFTTSLFIDVMPFELNFVSGSSTNGNIDCSQFPMDTNNPNASPIFPNHPDHSIVACSYTTCLLYTSDAADERSSVDLGGRRIIKKKKKQHITQVRTATEKNYIVNKTATVAKKDDKGGGE